MTNLEKLFGPPTQELLETRYVVAVARHQGSIYWLLVEPENLILDLTKRRDEFLSAGYQYPELVKVTDQRSGIAVFDQADADKFLVASGAKVIAPAFLRSALLERFPTARSWWDVGFLFPVAFVDFDRRYLAAFSNDGPRFERYVPDGWLGELTDFANTLPNDVFPVVDKFWMVEGRDLLSELNDRGRALEANCAARGYDDDV